MVVGVRGDRIVHGARRARQVGASRGVDGDGPGKLLEGSHNVLIGNRVEGGAEDDPGSAAHTHEGGFLVLDEDGEPLVDAPYLIRTAAGKTYRGRTDGRGHTKLVFTRNAEDIEIELLDEGEECAS